MENMQVKITPNKTTLVKQAAWLAVLYAAISLTSIMLLVNRQISFIAESLPLSIISSVICIIFLAALTLLTIKQCGHAKNAEKEDELSRLNRYKAGYISKYICIVIIIAAIWIIKDFGFAFTSNFIDNIIHLPLAILMFAQFVENIIFITLEKSNLE